MLLFLDLAYAVHQVFYLDGGDLLDRLEFCGEIGVVGIEGVGDLPVCLSPVPHIAQLKYRGAEDYIKRTGGLIVLYEL